MAHIIDANIKADLQVFKSNELANAAATYLYEKITDVISKKGLCRIALSGGSTPIVAFGLLAKTNIEWDKLQIFFADERCVPPSHEDSNYFMLTNTLLKAPIPEQNVFRFKAELEPKEAATEYSQTIEKTFGTKNPVFDIVQLGMGDDGHTASLFPNTTALEAVGIAVENHLPQKDTWRLTLTKNTINNADHVVFLVGGKGKSKVLKNVLTGEYIPKELPTQLIKAKNRVVFLLDEEAAELSIK